MKFYELADEEFRIAVFEKLNELQENWKRQLKKIIKKHTHTNSGAEDFNEWNEKSNRAHLQWTEQMEDRIGDFEDRNFEISHLEENKGKKCREETSKWSMGFHQKNKY